MPHFSAESRSRFWHWLYYEVRTVTIYVWIASWLVAKSMMWFTEFIGIVKFASLIWLGLVFFSSFFCSFPSCESEYAKWHLQFIKAEVNRKKDKTKRATWKQRTTWTCCFPNWSACLGIWTAVMCENECVITTSAKRNKMQKFKTNDSLFEWVPSSYARKWHPLFMKSQWKSWYIVVGVRRCCLHF